PMGWSFGQPPSRSWTPIGGDFNGDGKTDYLMIAGPYELGFLSSGDGTFRTFNGTQFGDYGSPATNNWQPIVGDFGGDGKTDYMMVAGTQQLYFMSDRGSGGGMYRTPFSRMKSITTGLGAAVYITYVPLTDGTVYSKSSGDAYPLQDAQPSLFVVRQVDTSNGLGGYFSSSYHYSGAVFDLSGRGFLCFKSTTVTDSQTSIVETTNYLQPHPYTGLVASRIKTLGTLVLNQTNFTYGLTPQGASRFQVSIATTVERSTDLDGTALPTVTTTYQYDGYGNPTQI